MKISASELVKRSASQLLYKEVKKIEYKVTKGQIQGNLYSKEIVEKENASEEKRGIIQLDDTNILFFCVDMVKDNKLVEIKMVNDMSNYEDWYLKISLIQATFYCSLCKDVKTLDTPKFKKKEGYKQEIINIPKNFSYELWFGKDRYKVYNNQKIKDHYIEKALLVSNSVESRDFNSCKEFDLKYKFKEFSIFNPRYKKLNI